MEKEYWVDIKDYEGLYQISNLVKIKSLDRIVKGKNNSLRLKKGKILKLYLDKDGYQVVMLYKNGANKFCKVHRLMAQAFIPNPLNLPQVNHKDENKQNNNVENLEWCDNKYNQNYGTRNERISKTNRHSKFCKKVYQYDLNGNLIKEWVSTKECGRNGYNQGHVAACCRGKRKTHKGFIWSYEKLGE